MYKNCSIVIIIPSYNEEKRIGRVLETIPAFVDHVVVVDDCSKDRTPEIVLRTMESDRRIELLRHESNQGVGGAIASGYIWARDRGAAIAAVMAGDGQMDPADLPSILDPIARGEADFCKGNRLIDPVSRANIPKLRLAGNIALSFLTRLITGWHHIDDTQNGYTAASKKVLDAINWECLYKKYGQPNDLLVKLSRQNFRIAEVPNRAIYHAGSASKMNILMVVIPISLLLLKLALQKALKSPLKTPEAKKTKSSPS